MCGLSAAEAAAKFGYRLSAFYSLVRDFSKYLKEGHPEDFFFKDTVSGRKPGKDDDYGDIETGTENIQVDLKKKRELPLIYENLWCIYKFAQVIE